MPARSCKKPLDQKFTSQRVRPGYSLVWNTIFWAQIHWTPISMPTWSFTNQLSALGANLSAEASQPTTTMRALATKSSSTRTTTYQMISIVMDRQNCRRFYNVDQDYCQKICSMGGMFFLRIHHICQFSCTNQFLDWANFSSNFYTEIFTQQFPSSLEALFYLWKREWPGQTITSPHLTSIHTRLYRQTSFDGLETETKWVLWNKLMKHPDFLHVCRGLNYKRSRSLSLKYNQSY